MIINNVPGIVHTASFSPDGKWIVVSAFAGIACWNAATGKARWHVPLHKPYANTLFSPDGHILALNLKSDLPGKFPRQSVELWDAATGARKFVLPTDKEDYFSHFLAFSPDSRWLAYSDGQFHIADTQAGTKRYSLPKGAGCPVAFASDSKSLVSVGKVLERWDFTTGKRLSVSPDTTEAGHTRGVKRLLFAPNGKRLVSVGWNDKIMLWDLKACKPQQVKASKPSSWPGWDVTITFPDDGRCLLWTGDVEGLVAQDLETGKVVTRLAPTGVARSGITPNSGRWCRQKTAGSLL